MELNFAQAPWLGSWRLLESCLASTLDGLLALPPTERLTRLNKAAGDLALRWRFVEHPGRFAGAYEEFIVGRAAIPTRLDGPGSLHDLLNALAWLRFPRTKALLNALQARAIARDGVGSRRGALRDGMTLLDENGLLLVVHDMGDGVQLRRQDWQELLMRGRERWFEPARIEAIPIGHGLVERLRKPYLALTAHVRIVRMPQAWFALPQAQRLVRLDRTLAARLSVRALRPAELFPLPVLGIPGWWIANEDCKFYDDTRVFRVRRA